MRIVLTALLLVSAISANGQFFEGRIVYQNTYRSKVANVTDEQLSSALGTKQEYFIKGGSYRSVTNGSYLHWMLYVNAENRGYRKLHGRDTLLWDDAGVNSNPVLKIEINNAGAEILGYKCDEAILTTKLGVEKYYFSTKLGVDVSAYAKHSLANWYDLIKATRSLPLKAIVETSLFTVTSVATEVTEMKLDDSEFQLPKNVKSEKSPS